MEGRYTELRGVDTQPAHSMTVLSQVVRQTSFVLLRLSLPRVWLAALVWLFGHHNGSRGGGTRQVLLVSYSMMVVLVSAPNKYPTAIFVCSMYVCCVCECSELDDDDMLTCFSLASWKIIISFSFKAGEASWSQCVHAVRN